MWDDRDAVAAAAGEYSTRRRRLGFDYHGGGRLCGRLSRSASHKRIGRRSGSVRQVKQRPSRRRRVRL